ncbi:MAG: enoyl-CoA hydratase/isomerase family protein [Chloroflexi bacterium]|nr:enoyl-CoA hydratase/isomerase family protein [Chloroflexota bacterium]
MGSYNEIELTIEDPVGLITLNRPEKLNAVTYSMLAEIRDAVDRCAKDPAVVGIVITGAGRGFCSGLDSQALVDVTASGGRNRAAPDPDEVPGMFTYLLSVPKPVIAAINGVAAGGGLALIGMCDLRFASTNASFTTVFLKRGLISEHGTSWILPRLLGPGRALDLLWTSDRIDAQRAHEIGLVEYLCEPGDLVEQAKLYVRRLAASASPASIADTKELVYSQLGMGYADALRATEPVQWAAVARPDAVEGAQALVERREPKFPRLGG